MKSILIGMMVAVLMLTANMAGAQTKELAIVTELNGDTVHITLPTGPGMELKDMDVVVYDDAAQAAPRSLGSVLTFTLLPGQGFTFTFSDASGSYWQLVTPKTPTGSGISIDCSNGGGCKYFRPAVR